MPERPYPLEGLKVLDLTQYVSGPYCTQIFADLGATVLKVERPGRGDVYRSQGPVFVGPESISFLSVNRGKRSIALDLTDAGDLERVLELVDDADVLVENMKPGTLARRGLDFASLEKRNPRLIYCSISGFGQTGPLANTGAYDLTTQALSGLLAITGHPGGAPAKIPVAALDFGSAMYGVIGTLAALEQRHRTGRGQWVQTSLLETSLAWLAMHICAYLAGGEEPQPLGTRSPFFAPYEAYRTADGHLVVVGTGGNDGWGSFCRALGLERLIDDERFRDNGLRVANADALRDEVEAVLGTHPTVHWTRLLSDAGVPNAPVGSLGEVLTSEQVKALGIVTVADHPRAGPVSLVRLPIVFSGSRATAERLSPMLDEHAELDSAPHERCGHRGAAPDRHRQARPRRARSRSEDHRPVPPGRGHGGHLHRAAPAPGADRRHGAPGGRRRDRPLDPLRRAPRPDRGAVSQARAGGRARCRRRARRRDTRARPRTAARARRRRDLHARGKHARHRRACARRDRAPPQQQRTGGTTMSTLLTWHERFSEHDTGTAALYLPEGGLVEGTLRHVDNPDRVVRTREVVRRAGLETVLDVVEPPAATAEQVELAHSPEHVARMQAVSEAGGGDAGGGFTPMDAQSYDLALLSAGSVVEAVRRVVRGDADNAYALVRKAGHHASRDTGLGFCIFNNTAVAARVAQVELGVERVAIVDFDVHHGNGTEAIFAADPSVLTISLHQDRMFPPDTGGLDEVGSGPGAGTNLNLPLPPGTGDRGYELAIADVVVPVVRSFAPDLVLVGAGVDASVFDPMARMAVTASGFGTIADHLLDLASSVCDGRVVFAQEGGYSPAYGPFCALAMIEALAGGERHEDPFEAFLAPVLRELADYQREAVAAVGAHHAKHWPALVA